MANDLYSIALDARVYWAHHRVSTVAGDEERAEWNLGWALKRARRCGEAAARESMACPHLLADEPLLARAWTSAFDAACLKLQKLRTREGLDEWISTMASEANRGCGLSYELFVKRFSVMVDDALDQVEPAYRDLAIEVAKAHDYATAEELDAMQEEIENSGGCSLTGIDPDCCPCGRHE